MRNAILGNDLKPGYTLKHYYTTFLDPTVLERLAPMFVRHLLLDKCLISPQTFVQQQKKKSKNMGAKSSNTVGSTRCTTMLGRGAPALHHNLQHAQFLRSPALSSYISTFYFITFCCSSYFSMHSLVFFKICTCFYNSNNALDGVFITEAAS